MKKYLNLYSPPYYGGWKYIWIYIHHQILGEKIYLNFFSTPFFGRRKYIQIYFHQHIFDGENKFEFIFTPVYWGEKIHLKIFFPDHYRKGRNYISINDQLPASFSYCYGSFHYIVQIAICHWLPRKVKQVRNKKLWQLFFTKCIH